MTPKSGKRFYDVVVIGGGPAGSTVATLVAMRGHDVLLLERQLFPRHQIGESLLPATIHGVCPILGLSEELARAGFMRKAGGTFKWGMSEEPWVFDFARAKNVKTGYAYQVERSRFDEILLKNAQRKGVTVLQEASVTHVTLDSGTGVGVRFQDSSGAPHDISARFAVDAGGAESRFHGLVGERRFSKFFQNIAIYAYFENGRRLPEPNAGNIFCATFADGWFWYIPLTATLTSVGAVVSTQAAEVIKGGHEQAFAGFLEKCPSIREMLAGATRVTEGPYGRYRVRQDYSYSNTSFYKGGLALIGDAACFVDPVFSSGVHLATYAGLLAARSINTSLTSNMSLATQPGKEECFAEFERRYRREYGCFYQFLIAFYDMYKDKDSYFWEARKILNTDETANEAFVRLVAGLSDGEDPAFSTVDYLQDRRVIGDWMQRTYRVPAGDSVTSAADKPDGIRVEPEAFMQQLVTESANVQLQGQLGARRPTEEPIVRGGLVPSRDGLGWLRSARAN